MGVLVLTSTASVLRTNIWINIKQIKFDNLLSLAPGETFKLPHSVFLMLHV